VRDPLRKAEAGWEVCERVRSCRMRGSWSAHHGSWQRSWQRQRRGM